MYRELSSCSVFNIIKRIQRWGDTSHAEMVLLEILAVLVTDQIKKMGHGVYSQCALHLLFLTINEMQRYFSINNIKRQN